MTRFSDSYVLTKLLTPRTPALRLDAVVFQTLAKQVFLNAGRLRKVPGDPNFSGGSTGKIR